MGAGHATVSDHLAGLRAAMSGLAAAGLTG
jgi:hypothetical protein